MQLYYQILENHEKQKTLILSVLLYNNSSETFHLRDFLAKHLQTTDKI